MKKLIILILGLLVSQASPAQILNPSVGKKVFKQPTINYLKKIDNRLWTTLINGTLRQSYLKINNFDPAGTDASEIFSSTKKMMSSCGLAEQDQKPYLN